MMRPMYRITFALVAVNLLASAGVESFVPGSHNTQFGGYVEEIPIVVLSDDSTTWTNLVQARFNTAWFPMGFLSFTGQGRLLLYSGDPFSALDPLVAGFGNDPNYLDMTGAWPSVLYGNIDRLFVRFTLKNFSAQVGRQRINWGINYIWNPNDWFNASSLYDFSYEEQRGTDALRLIWYASVVSSVELALEAGETIHDRTLAAMYKFNKWEYDIQLQAGTFRRDLAMGAGFAGQLLDAGVRGELSYFHPAWFDNSFSPGDTTGKVVAALSADYTFRNSWYLHGEILFNGFGATTPTGITQIGQSLQPSALITAQNLAPARFAAFAQTAYNFTPLLRGIFSTTVNYFSTSRDILLYIGPSINWSLLQNIDLTVLSQVFHDTGESETTALIAAQGRWSF